MSIRVFAGFALTVGLGLAVQAESAKSPALTLGVGCYGVGTDGDDHLVDIARHDWGFVLLPQETAGLVKRLDDCCAMNPRFKAMLRLWFTPTSCDPADSPKASARPVRFLDYLYCPAARAAFDAQALEQVDSVMTRVKHPERILGFTLFQDLPGPLAPRAQLNVTDPAARPDAWLATFADRYAAETGCKMEYWDRDLRIWWSRKFAEALGMMYAGIKARYPQLKGFTYFVNAHPCDFQEPGEDVHAPRILAARYSDFIRPGAADGFFCCCRNAYWSRRYREMAEANGWPYFMQLSHTPTKRLTTWSECLALARDPSPMNWGYFHYEGDFVTGQWNDDPDVQADETASGVHDWTRARRCLAKADVGMDVVRRYLKPEVTLLHSAANITVGDVGTVVAEIVNPRTEDWFVDASEATLRNVRVRLTMPDAFDICDRYSVPDEVLLDKLKPGARTSVLWWVRRRCATVPEAPLPFAVEVTAPGVEPVRFATNRPECQKDPEAPIRVRQSGDKIRYVNWKMGGGKHSIEITLHHRRRSRACVIDPMFEFGGLRYGWRGEVPEGAKLILRPDRTATLVDAKGVETDVTAGLLGRPFTVRAGTSEITYFDQAGVGAASGGWKAEVCLIELKR